jgi:hypothetical protein
MGGFLIQKYPISDDIEGLKWTLSKMVEACNKPVIDYNTGEERD